ncbi:MAG: hypothetical protein KJO50_01605 [Bacteroidia bacterium]|nr:hypothetical protein [Bacteroidia bacterium]MBT8228925.1 hypothetical protein [Bacteroidia bacterium]NNK89369.1 hypothetical protein [Saprospiraceae bacterium]
MSLLDSARLFIYRCHEKGLEILLINHDFSKDPGIWTVPSTRFIDKSHVEFIELDSFRNEDGQEVKAFAIEADWHDIPSIRGLIKHDVKAVKSKIKSSVIEFEKGAYFTFKEAFRKVLPTEYEALKELKDIVLDRNLVKNI